MGNSINWDKYRRRVPDEILKYLPSDWHLDMHDLPSNASADAIVRIVGPDGSRAEVALEFKASLPPSVARTALSNPDRSPFRNRLLVAPYFSPQTQRFLREREASYLDLSGNVYWTLRSPALFISSTGAKESFEKHKTGRTLRGAKAGRLMRELCDRQPPFTVTSLARELSIDYGNVSRYLELLQRDALITREPRGPVRKVDWEGVLRRWSQDYRRPHVERYFDPRGVEHFQRAIASAAATYVLSGLAAATSYAPATVTNTVLCYCDEPESVAEVLGLKRADRHSNVTLSTPFDPVVYSRTKIIDGNVVAAPTQAVIDLLIGHGRELQQADELIEWMKEHQDEWRR
jgi:hypothetical protein